MTASNPTTLPTAPGCAFEPQHLGAGRWMQMSLKNGQIQSAHAAKYRQRVPVNGVSHSECGKYIMESEISHVIINKIASSTIDAIAISETNDD